MFHEITSDSHTLTNFTSYFFNDYVLIQFFLSLSIIKKIMFKDVQQQQQQQKVHGTVNHTLPKRLMVISNTYN